MSTITLTLPTHTCIKCLLDIEHKTIGYLLCTKYYSLQVPGHAASHPHSSCSNKLWWTWKMCALISMPLLAKKRQQENIKETHIWKRVIFRLVAKHAPNSMKLSLKANKMRHGWNLTRGHRNSVLVLILTYRHMLQCSLLCHTNTFTFTGAL